MSIGNNLRAGTKSELVSHTEMDQNPEWNEQDENINTQLFCVIKSGGEQYAIPMDLVKEVVKFPTTTPIPQMPSYFSSMANVRGEVYGILDLSKFFQDHTEDQEYNYLLIINDEDYRVALALNTVPNTLKVEDKKIEELSSSALGSLKGKKSLSGIVKHDKQTIISFDVKGMISSEKFTEVFT